MCLSIPSRCSDVGKWGLFLALTSFGMRRGGKKGRCVSENAAPASRAAVLKLPSLWTVLEQNIYLKCTRIIQRSRHETP